MTNSSTLVHTIFKKILWWVRFVCSMHSYICFSFLAFQVKEQKTACRSIYLNFQNLLIPLAMKCMFSSFGKGFFSPLCIGGSVFSVCFKTKPLISRLAYTWTITLLLSCVCGRFIRPSFVSTSWLCGATPPPPTDIQPVLISRLSNKWYKTM